MKMLEIKKISKEYGDMIAVNDIDLEINKGEIFGILGPNGAGKSTLIGMICGLIKRASGEIIYEEKETKKSLKLSKTMVYTISIIGLIVVSILGFCIMRFWK